MGRIIVLPNQHKPGSSGSVKDWTKGGVVPFSAADAVRVSGGIVCANSYTIGGPNTEGGGRSGNIYTSSSGALVNVQTKKLDNPFYTTTYYGHTDIPPISGGVLNGGNLANANIRNNTEANWNKHVKGFYCEVSSQPTGSGSEADGCGTIKSMEIAGVFVTSSGTIKVFSMINKGVKITGHNAGSEIPRGWTRMSYYVGTNDMLNMYHMGWIVQYHHEKTCGGGGVQKNCTGRVRYLQPLVSDHGGLYTSNPPNHQIIMRRRKWSDVSKNEFYIA